jgi:hypothetical protein
MTMFEREDWKLFRNLDTLCQKAGVNVNSIPRLVVKELVDNALDVSKCELDRLYKQNGFYVRDFGKGLSEEQIKSLFSINRPMITSKLLRLPSRGALGNGLRVVAGAVVSTNGSMFVETKGKRYEVVFDTNGIAQPKEISYSDILDGTRVEVIFGNIFTFTSSDLNWGNDAIFMARGVEFKCKTSPYWYTSEAFYELMNAFDGSLWELLSYFDGINKNKIIEYESSYDVPTRLFTFEMSEKVLKALRDICKPVSIKKLGIADEYPNWGQYSKKSGEFVVKSAKGEFDASIPFVVEVWMDKREKFVPIIFVNKTPITGAYNYWYEKKQMNMYSLGLRLSVKSKPCQTVVNIITPYMPITSDGKSPDFSKMNDIIEKCILSSRNKVNREVAADSEVSSNKEKDIIYAYMDKAIEKASGDGQYRFSQRQLYYAIRPYVMQLLDKQTGYTYFCKLLTDYENEYGEIENLYRDPRGVLYHPHMQEEIPLGTIAVQNYERPEWTFNKIIYCEKEGFFPILKDAKFPERFDCALLTSKGYASRAVKDLFDLLGETNEEILFFCIHDADAAGTMIYETLQEATNSRRARKVKVINLGLDPWEAVDMDLEVEEFTSKSRRPVAGYIHTYDYRNGEDYSSWLQNSRIELNAMTTPQFLEWIEEKVIKYDNGKVIPDGNTIQRQLISETDRIIQQRVMQRILKENNYQELVEREKQVVQPIIDAKITTLRQDVKMSLDENQESSWKKSVQDIAEDIV